MTKSKSGGFFKELLHKKVFPLIILLIFEIVLFSVWANAIGAKFFAITTIRNILNNMVFAAFLTIGAGCLMLSGNMDLSASTIGAMAGIVCAWSVTHSIPWYLAMLMGIVVGVLFGLLNSFIITKFRFPSFIATLGMASVVRGLMYFASSIGKEDHSAQNINFLNDTMYDIGNKKLFSEFTVLLVIMLIVYIIFAILVARTKFGTKIKMLGGNPVAANLAGINSKGIITLLYVISGGMAGIAGVLFACKMQQGSLGALSTAQFTGLTGAILGGISFGGGEGGLGGAFVGMLILNTFTVGMSVCNVNSNLSTIFNGLLLIIALALDFFRQARRNKV